MRAGLGCYLTGPRSGGTLPRRPSWATVAAALGAGGSEPRGDEDSADKRGPGVSGWGGAWAAVATRPFGWARPRCWAAQRAAVLRALGRAGRGGELGWGWCWVAVLGSGERREGQRAEIQEGRGIKVILLFFFFLQFSKTLF